MMRRTWGVVLTTLVISAWTSAPSSRAQQADLRVSGVVVTDEATPRPVRRAVVTLRGEQLSGLSAVADDQGRFAFERVGAGRYRLTADRPGFVAAEYGASVPGGSGVPLQVRAGAALENLTLQMARGAAISGLVVDAVGRPLPDVQVMVMPADQSVAGIIQQEEMMLTDDRGAYRAFGLAPGAYLVVALPPFAATGELESPQSEAIDRMLERLRTRPMVPMASNAERAAPPGSAPARAPSADRPPTLTYAPLYYPGTPTQPLATRIEVGAGDDRAGIDIALVPVPTASIEGTVLGAPQGGAIRLTISGASVDAPTMLSRPELVTPPGADGRFAYRSLVPGRYTITAQVADTDLWASQEVDVDGAAVTGVTLALRAGLRFSGRVATAGSASLTPDDLQAMRITLMPSDGASGGLVINGARYGRRFRATGTVDGAGTFEVTGALPGRYEVTATLPAPVEAAGWWLRAVMLGDRDLLDEPLELSTEDLEGVEVVLSNQVASLAGSLTTAAAEPALAYSIVLLSANPTHWRAGARRTVSSRPDSAGQFGFADLPGGDYLLAAVRDLDPAQLDDPDFLRQLAAGGVPVTLVEGEEVRQELRISGSR